MTDRSKYLGASEAGAVLGLSPYRTPLRVWQEKTGQIVQDPPGIPMRAGNALEALVLDLFTEKTGEAVAFRQAEYSDSANPFLVCHVDGIAGESVVEAKTTGSDRGWGIEGTDEIPNVYLAQVAVQMYLTGLREAWVPVLIGREDFRIYRVERDKEIEAIILPKLIRFWRENVEKAIPPPPVSLEDVRAMFPRSELEEREATEEIAGAVDRLRAIKRNIKDLTAEQEALETQILSYLGSSESLTYHGKVLATWKNQTSKRLNTSRLKELYPQAVEECTGESESRVFRLKTTKED